MIVGYDAQRIERIIDDLEFTAKASKDVATHYEEALRKSPEQVQWNRVIGKSKGRAELAQEIINKLRELIQ
jgi:signal recognition particle subunit SEC65